MSLSSELTMSDEDFLQSFPEDFDNKDEEVLDSPDTSVSESPTEPTEDFQEEEVGEDESESDESTEALEEDEQSESDEEEADEDEEDTTETTEVDYKAQYEQLLKPFKANGSEMQVKDVNEAITLMQMGANYNKKMVALKPNLKKMKMLENNDLFDEDKLNLMIEIAKGNPDAISKVIKDSGIDPLDLDIEESKYTPKNHTVGDNEVELDEVVSRIQDTPTFADTIDIVSSKWDDASKRSIATAPKDLEVLNSQVGNGIYSYVTAEVERQRAFGQLSDLSDFNAYKQVSLSLLQEGKITPHGVVSREILTKPTVAKVDKQKDKKRSASPVRNTGSSKPKVEFNPLDMSDEDFEKQFN